jgi:hypothetical protein
MAKRKVDPFDFPSGANVVPKKPRARGGKKPRSAAQKAAAQFYALQKGRRR